MKRVYKYLFVFLGSLFIFPLVSNAQCSYERQAELSKIAANVKFSYTFEMQETVELRPLFKIFITNLTNDIYIVDDYNGLTILGTGEKQVNYGDVSSATFKIYSNDPACRGELLMTQHVNMPSYNPYSRSEECKQNSDFKFCDLWNAEPSSEAQFNEELEKQKSQQKVKENIDNENAISYFLEKNKSIIIATIIAIIALIVIIFIRKKHFGKM